MPKQFAFPAFIAQDTPEQDAAAVSRIAPLLLQPGQSAPRDSEIWAFSDSVEDAVRALDGGASYVISKDTALAGQIPEDRLLLHINSDTATPITDKSLLDNISGLFVEVPVDQSGAIEPQLLQSFRDALGGKQSIDSKLLVIAPQSQQALNYKELAAAISSASIAAIPSFSALSSQQSAELLIASLRTDRTDGLFGTIVSSPVCNSPLGLVYSSAESIANSVTTGKGTYYSRSRNGLWVKGETSGATQEVVRIRRDCDGDAIEVVVRQKRDTSFCHTNRAVSCFGPTDGLSSLTSIIASRLAAPVEGSYTAKLLNNPSMLNAKIREEADELCRATKQSEIAAEAADLLYFALVKAQREGVELEDVARVLSERSCKVTRRPGLAKQQFVQEEEASNKASGSQTADSKPLPSAKPLPSLPPQPSESDPIIPQDHTLAGISRKDREGLLVRPVASSTTMLAKVNPILDSIKSKGDEALRGYIKAFDQCSLAEDKSWEHVITAPFTEELMQLDEKVKKAIDVAYSNIHAFHKAQMDKEDKPLVVETMPGITCTRFVRPIDRVGLYIPGGTAVLPSTALMLAIPAAIAGCKYISVASPPGKEGKIRPEIVYIAQKCGVQQIVMAGGAQAIAAMAYGTETVGKVDKVFGPGNQWVTAAKMAVSMDSSAVVSIDMPAGPSEVLVIADHTANPAYVAADLLSQAEHGVDSQVVLLAINLAKDHLAEIKKEIDAQARALPRVAIIRQCIAQSLIIECESLEQALDFSNDYAPEHLILHLENARDNLPAIRNAGSVFVGAWSPESCGDYASGTNHTLPTAGYARQYSGVNTLSFCKHITSQELTKEGLMELGPTVDTLAVVEGLEAHANAVRVRMAAA